MFLNFLNYGLCYQNNYSYFCKTTNKISTMRQRNKKNQSFKMQNFVIKLVLVLSFSFKYIQTTEADLPIGNNALIIKPSNSIAGNVEHSDSQTSLIPKKGNKRKCDFFYTNYYFKRIKYSKKIISDAEKRLNHVYKTRIEILKYLDTFEKLINSHLNSFLMAVNTVRALDNQYEKIRYQLQYFEIHSEKMKMIYLINGTVNDLYKLDYAFNRKYKSLRQAKISRYMNNEKTIHSIIKKLIKKFKNFSFTCKYSVIELAIKVLIDMILDQGDHSYNKLFVDFYMKSKMLIRNKESLIKEVKRLHSYIKYLFTFKKNRLNTPYSRFFKNLLDEIEFNICLFENIGINDNEIIYNEILNLSSVTNEALGKRKWPDINLFRETRNKKLLLKILCKKEEKLKKSYKELNNV